MYERPTLVWCIISVMDFIIRKVNREDASKISRLITHTLRTSNAADYPVDVLDGICLAYNEAGVMKIIEERYFFCIEAKPKHKHRNDHGHEDKEESYNSHENLYKFGLEHGPQILGTGALAASPLDSSIGWITAVFVSPDHQGYGLGYAIMDYLEKEAIKHGITSLKLKASLTAYDFYKRMGYVDFVETVADPSQAATAWKSNLYLMKKELT